MDSCGKGSACGAAFLIVQAHHDFCDYNAMPTGIEKGFHDYESVCANAGCAIKRQYIDSLPLCETEVGTITCDASGLPDQQSARSALMDKDANCNAICDQNGCKEAFMKVLYYHDSCEADEVDPELETALHTYEGTCTEGGLAACNIVEKAFEANECNGVSNLDADGNLKGGGDRKRRSEFKCP